ncbi:MADS-box protein SOC1-like [Nicotiana tabacum]|uniref:MADS-box protein SOC1-like n=1 Tax=Nicotiana tabacum TaxID=4097 RepID=A0AC58S0I9_TOBAC
MERNSSQIRKNVERDFVRDKRAEVVAISNMQKALCKKAKEISILCGIEIAILIFSIIGQPFLFGSPNVESVVRRFLKAKQPIASPLSGYISYERISGRKRKEEMDKKKKKFEKLDQNIKKLSNYLIEEIAQLQFVNDAEDPNLALEMNVTSSSTLPSNWLSL